MDWQATVHGVAKSQTRLSNEHFHFFSFIILYHIPLKKKIFVYLTVLGLSQGTWEL